MKGIIITCVFIFAAAYAAPLQKKEYFPAAAELICLGNVLTKASEHFNATDLWHRQAYDDSVNIYADCEKLDDDSAIKK